LRQLLFILLACSVPSFIWAQGMKEVSGTVYGPDGKALQGVNVTIKGGSRGATTNEQGRYSILAVNSDILVYSFTGHTIQEQRVGERAIIDVTLESGTSDLDQVVVVGYGEKKKVTVTGSVVSVKGRDLQKAPVVNLSN